MQVVISQIGQAQVLVYIVGLVLFLAWESLHPFFSFFRSSGRVRASHIIKNLVLGAINSLVIALAFVAMWVAASIWAEEHSWGLLNQLSLIGLPPWAHAVGAVLLFDAWTYTWHRLNHRIPFLWRFHRVHHSDTKMDVSTAGRFHVGEIILSSALRIPLIVLLGVYAWELLLYETIMFGVVQFHHANIGVPPRLDRILRIAIVTPAMHKVHHSRLMEETDSNYSALFSFWDRAARSFRLRPDPHEIEFGLDQFAGPEADSLAALIKMPLVQSDRSAPGS